MTPVLISALVASTLYLLYRLALPKPLPGIPYNHTSARSLFGDLPGMLKHVKANHTLFDYISAQCESLNSPIIQVFATPFNLSAPKVVLTDARESRDILTRRSADFDRGDFIREVLSGVTPHATLVMPTNATYKKQAKMLAECMQQKFLHDVAGVHIWQSVNQLVELWTLKAEMAERRSFEAAEDLKKVATDAIWNCAFGSDLGSVGAEMEFLAGVKGEGGGKAEIKVAGDGAVDMPGAPAPEDYEAVKTVNDAVEACTTAALPRLHHFLTRLTPTYRRAAARKDALIDANLAAAKARLMSARTHASEDRPSSSPYSDEPHTTCATDIALRWELKSAAKESRVPILDQPAIRDELLAFVLGGFDPTSKALCWLVKALAAHPNAQRQVRDSLHTAFASSSAYEKEQEAFSRAAVIKKQLPILDAFIEETLRLSCVAQGQPRKAIRDTVVLGHAIPKGTDVYMMCNAYGYRKPEFWAAGAIDERSRSLSSRTSKDSVGTWDPKGIEDFDIGRWLKSSPAKFADGGDEKEEVVFDPRAGPTSPFDGGLRGCFGKKLAYLEMKIFVAVLVWHFEFLEVEGELANNRASQKLFVAPEVTHVRLRKINGEVAGEGEHPEAY